MNRRGFLKLLGIAPAVAPQIAQAALAERPRAIYGELISFDFATLKSSDWDRDYRAADGLLNSPEMREAQVILRGDGWKVIHPSDTPLSVLDQMREHDIFDLSGEATRSHESRAA